MGKSTTYTTNPKTGAVIMSHVYENPCGERILLVDTNTNESSMSNTNFKHIHTYYANSAIAKEYIQMQ